MLIAFFVFVLCKQCKRAYASVYLGHSHTLREESARHTHRVALPLVYKACYGKRRDEEYIACLEPLYHIVAHTPVRQVDDHIGIYLGDILLQLPVCRYWIDIHTRFLESQYQITRVYYLSCNHYLGSSLVPEVFFFEPSFVVGYRIKLRVVG